MAFIPLVPKTDLATIQTRPRLDTREHCLSHYFHNRLWDHSSAATIKGAAFNQVNTVFKIQLKCIHAKTAKLYKRRSLQKLGEKVMKSKVVSMKWLQ